MLISCLYRPPRGKIQNCIDRLTETYARRENAKVEIWLIGDFNVDFLKRGESNLVKFLNFFKRFGCTQLINDTTRPGKHKCSCIDWIVTNSNFISESSATDMMLSDHYVVYCIKKKSRERVSYVYRYFRNYKLYNAQNFINLFRLGLDSLEQNFLEIGDPNVLWKHVYDIATGILEVMCPFRRYRQREFPTPWMTPDIYTEIRLRARFVKLFNRFRSNNFLILLRRQRNKVNSLIDNAKRDYIINSLHQNSKNPKKFWRIVNNMLKGSSEKSHTVQFIDPDSNDPMPDGFQADFLNSYFCNISKRLGLSDSPLIAPEMDDDLHNMYGHIDSEFELLDDEILSAELEMFVKDIDVCKSSCVHGINTMICKKIMVAFPQEISYIFRRSVITGIFPYEWSRGCITVIPKGGVMSNPSNRRPIMQTSIFAKVFEKLIYRRIMSYFDDNQILSNYQYGFRPRRLTQQSIFDLLKFVYSSLNNKKLFAAICLNVCKAFDCINHDVLLFKLAKIGFSYTSLAWFKSYLNRTQTVRFNDTISKPLSCITGIGQGTILGPLIFIFYINDVVQAKGNLMLNMYADDCILFKSGNNWNLMCDSIQLDLDNINSWCVRNRLKLSESKSELLHIGSIQKLGLVDRNRNINLGNVPLQFVDRYKYLGIILDKHMDLTSYLSVVKKNVSNHLLKLRKIRKYVPQDCAVRIYKQTILPILDYGGSILNSCNQSDRSDLQIMQNNALRICYNVRLRDRMSVKTLHKNAKLLSLDQRRKVQLLSLMFIHKFNHDVRRPVNRHTRGADRFKFKLERYNTVKYKNSPYYKGSELWDSLALATINCDNLFEFKQCLRKRFINYLQD